jgi:lipopolysaccharide/colanic/teichoic acid biosynthesis glycosyltransferase
MSTYPGKRTLDILVSGAARLALASVMAGVTVATWLEDRGSPLSRQTRVGSHRRPFTIIKFRSMRKQRVTHTGQWLRQTGIDELPQFLNVLRGERSVVGPRPLTGPDIDRPGCGDSGHDWRFGPTQALPGCHNCTRAEALGRASGSTGFASSAKASCSTCN